MRDRLIEILREPIPVIRGIEIFGESRMSAVDAERHADHLLANGVIVPPCKDENTDYKKLYENLLEDFEHALHFAGKNNNVCNFCEHDCGEKGICKGREVDFRCQPKWRGIMKSKGSEE